MIPARTVRTVPHRALTLEFAMWVFTRISGAALLLMGVAGMLGALYMGARTQMDLPTLMRWTFFPNPNHVVNSNISDVNLGWANAYWRLMEYLILAFGVTHGFNGVRVVMEDYVRNVTLRRVLLWVIVVLWGVVLAAGVHLAATS
jgi:succinate dehydrogenase hydrophobic anchor subunit